ncbi:MAG TPA: ribosome-associated translation inhibitor RaiA [Candidatus Saccharimonadales bacterium]|nr:ribosome-associated translation inhibitor RaiA [Candidatus Saccharimonadales bacterium]
MIERFDIHFIHTDHDDNLRKYVTRKIGHLDRYLPRQARASAHAEVLLKEDGAKDGRCHTCEVTLHLPHEVINIQETSINMYTAVDIVELKLKHQIQKYKDLHVGNTFRRRLATRLAR